MACYRGEQYDPDLGLYYLRARYYNPVTGRFMNVDTLAGDGQRRYQYAAADPVDGADPSGNFVLEAYRPLWAPLQIQIPIPTWCFNGTGTSVGGYLPPCKHHWIVMVNWRPLYGLSQFAFGHHPLGHWHHTYISIFNPDSDQGTDTWGVLGEKHGEKGTSKNQEVLYDDPRNNNVGGGETEVRCSDSEAQTLESALNATDYASGHVCPSCGANYHNWWWRQPPDGYNSNTYTWNMINNWGKTPPDELNAPGYHYAAGYAGYF
jgi:RHS repeat-associated protein